MFLLSLINKIADITPQVPSGLSNTPTDLNAVIAKVTNLLLYIVGATAVIMVVVGGFMYITSGGNPQRTKSAKDTILFAIVGMVIALLAYGIVNFVIGRFR